MAQASATLLQYPFQQRQLPLQFHLQRGVRLPGDFIPKTTLLASKVRLQLVGPAVWNQSRKGSWGESSRLRQDSRIMAASLGAEASAKARGSVSRDKNVVRLVTRPRLSYPAGPGLTSARCAR